MAAVETAPSIESTLAAIMAHPIRAKAFTILNERTASPKQIGEETGETTGNVSYHLRKLEDLGVIRIVDEQKRRGAVEHFYRANELAFVSDKVWAKLSPEKRHPYSSYVALRGVVDIARALDAGTFDRRHDRYLTRVRVEADEQGWGEFHALHEEMLERAMQIKENCANRLAQTPETETASVMQFATFFEEAPPLTKPADQ